MYHEMLWRHGWPDSTETHFMALKSMGIPLFTSATSHLKFAHERIYASICRLQNHNVITNVIAKWLNMLVYGFIHHGEQTGATMTSWFQVITDFIVTLHWLLKCVFVVYTWQIRDHFVHAPSQWETTLHSNVVSHWLGAYTKWSLPD